MLRRKPVLGVCGVCGCAQVQPTPEAVKRARFLDLRGQLWVSGHLYEEKPQGGLKLMLVRCLAHADEWDPRRQALEWG